MAKLLWPQLFPEDLELQQLTPQQREELIRVHRLREVMPDTPTDLADEAALERRVERRRHHPFLERLRRAWNIFARSCF